jgi:hypothetical protein
MTAGGGIVEAERSAVRLTCRMLSRERAMALCFAAGALQV